MRMLQTGRAHRLALSLCLAAAPLACGDDSEGPTGEGAGTGEGGETGGVSTKGDDPNGTADGAGDSSSADGSSTGYDGLDPDRETEEVIELGDEQWQAYTDIVIEATPEQVWEVLTDFDTMPMWSTSLQGIEGELSDGASVVVTIIFFEMTFELDHTLIYVDGEKYGWSDPILSFDGITDHHLYVVGETDGTHTLFIQEDTFTGTSDAATAQDLAEMTAPVYSTFNRELEQVRRTERAGWTHPAVRERTDTGTVFRAARPGARGRGAGAPGRTRRSVPLDGCARRAPSPTASGRDSVSVSFPAVARGHRTGCCVGTERSGRGPCGRGPDVP